MCVTFFFIFKNKDIGKKLNTLSDKNKNVKNDFFTSVCFTCSTFTIDFFFSYRTDFTDSRTINFQCFILLKVNGFCLHGVLDKAGCQSV